MTKSEIMKAAHAEAKNMVEERRYSIRGPMAYSEALRYGLRRVYGKIEADRAVAIISARSPTPKFMWLRGW